MKWYFQAIKKYAVFSGRARRREFWMFELWNALIVSALLILSFLTGLEGGQGIGVLPSIYILAVALPSFSSHIRRLHDTDHSGWWFLFSLVPLFGPITLFIFLVQDGTRGENRFGPNPKLEVTSTTPEMGTLAPPLRPE